jgi:hypothetical protein
MEAAFAQRTQYMATLENQYQRALQMVRELGQANVPQHRSSQSALGDLAKPISKE